MNKYKTVRFRLLFLVMIFISSLSLTLLIYSRLEQEEIHINTHISKTLQVERLLVDIEKQAYIQNIKNINTRSLIGHDINKIEEIYESEYKDDIFNHIEEGRLILEFETHLIDLRAAYTADELLNYDYEGISAHNQRIKLDLIGKIQSHSKVSDLILSVLALGMIVVIFFLTYVAYREIVLPLKKITKSLSDQKELHLMNEIASVKPENEISLLVDEYNALVRRNNLLLGLNEKINAQQRFDDVFDFIYNNLKPFIPYDRIGIAVLSNDGQSIQALTAKSNQKVILGRGYNHLLETSSLNQVIKSHDIRIINDLEAYYESHPFSESTRMILEEGMKSSVTLPLFHDDKAIGVVFFSSTDKNIYREDHQLFLINIASALSTSLEKSFIFENLMISTVRGFAKIVESKDHVTGNHIDRIGHYSGFIAKLLEDRFDSIDDRFIRSIERLSPLHDIGKVSVPDSILNKPGRLDEDEMLVMKGHSGHGGDILSELLVSVGASEFKMAVDIARHHHEKIDGSGYPDGIAGETIPLSARIVALADVFDALTSPRPYKNAFTFDEAIDIIKRDSGKHFDQVIVELLLENIKSFNALYNKLWSTTE